MDSKRLMADKIYDAGSLGCGDGPLPDIATTLRAMAPGSVLEIRSTDQAVGSDLQAWCRMTGHTYLGTGHAEEEGRHLVRRNDS
jgi:tRNA 2-thiouridine synthesizing protein A